MNYSRIYPALIIIFFLAVEPASAQVEINLWDIPNVPGTVFTYYTVSEPINGVEVDVGLSGENRRWDFAGYAFDEATNDTLLDPDEAPNRETFPNANRVVLSASNELGLNIGGGCQYELLADSGWFMIGAVGGAAGIEIPVSFPTPMTILPLPAEYGSSWEIAAYYDYAMVAPDTLMEGVLDSVIFRIAVGGFSELDGWGVIAYSGGEVPALRQRMSIEGSVVVVGVRYIFNQRLEIELPFGYEIQATQTYRWLSPSLGEIARVTSLLGEEDPNFNLASNIRVRRVIPELSFAAPPIAFGIVHVGNAGLATFRVSNSGEGVGSIYRIEFSGGLESEIEVITPIPLLVEHDSSATIRFLWSPVLERTLWPNQASIYHNDPDIENPLIASLYGATPEFESVERETDIHAGQMHLYPVSPNPFNSSALARFHLASSGLTSLVLIDMSGRTIHELFNDYREKGDHSVVIHGDELPAGCYSLRLQQGNTIKTTTVNLIK